MTNPVPLSQYCENFSKNLDAIYKNLHEKDVNRDKIVENFNILGITEYIWKDYRYKLRKSYAVNKINATKLKRLYPNVYKDCLETYTVKPTIIRTRVK
jgi:hypothetical protein